MTFVCRDIYYKNNKIIGVHLEDFWCEHSYISINKLKALLKANKIYVVNIKLSRDGRIIIDRTRKASGGLADDFSWAQIQSFDNESLGI